MNQVTINGKTYSGYNGSNISIINGVVIIDGKQVQTSQKEITITGNIEKLVCDKSVTVNGNVGNIESGGSVNCGDVKGNVTAGGHISCKRVRL